MLHHGRCFHPHGTWVSRLGILAKFLQLPLPLNQVSLSGPLSEGRTPFVVACLHEGISLRRQITLEQLELHPILDVLAETWISQEAHRPKPAQEDDVTVPEVLKRAPLVPRRFRVNVPPASIDLKASAHARHARCLALVFQSRMNSDACDDATAPVEHCIERRGPSDEMCTDLVRSNALLSRPAAIEDSWSGTGSLPTEKRKHGVEADELTHEYSPEQG